MAVFGERFVGLSNDVLFFFIGGDIVNLFRYDARFFVDAAVRSFNETEFIDLAETSQGRNQADVRTFRRFYRAHTAIVRMVDVADFKACTFTGQTAGAKGTQTAFMCNFSQGISLVHELGQLAGTKEFFNGGYDRANIDQDLGRNAFGILNRHAFADDTFHSGEADTELVLEEFADAAQTAVAKWSISSTVPKPSIKLRR